MRSTAGDSIVYPATVGLCVGPITDDEKNVRETTRCLGWSGIDNQAWSHHFQRPSHEVTRDSLTTKRYLSQQILYWGSACWTRDITHWLIECGQVNREIWHIRRIILFPDRAWSPMANQGGPTYNLSALGRTTIDTWPDSTGDGRPQGLTESIFVQARLSVCEAAIAA